MVDSDEDGRREYSDDDFLTAIQEGNQTAGEIADHLGCTRQAAHYRLKQLRDEGRVESDEVGNQLLWSITRL
ncbi:winged helix-turn-helix domain-containing protein [Halobium palmae]|uniref:Winged helix-turn-helix domain-containing protein n=1 Tax=Halobium palmae TaxID=1776492 RepID=A0ABD5RWF4_9EURY